MGKPDFRVTLPVFFAPAFGADFFLRAISFLLSAHGQTPAGLAGQMYSELCTESQVNGIPAFMQKSLGKAGIAGRVSKKDKKVWICFRLFKPKGRHMQIIDFIYLIPDSLWLGPT
ncbi:MAG: hypothetical protein N3D11_14610 [Candidatus Sumerlaeia bacterium]|nr:hypothetical protein [Candidatus Sumerlaeia bacterium]